MDTTASIRAMTTKARRQAIAALRPFAEIADLLDENDRDPAAQPGVVICTVAGAGGSAGITTDDVRRARAALRELTKTPAGKKK